MRKIIELPFGWKCLILAVLGVIGLFIDGRRNRARADVTDKVPTEEQVYAVHNKQVELEDLEYGDLLSRDEKILIVSRHVLHNGHAMVQGCLNCSSLEIDPEQEAKRSLETKIIKKDSAEFADAMRQFLSQKK